MEIIKNTPETPKYFTEPVIYYPVHIAKCSEISKTAKNILDILLIMMNTDNQVYLDEDTIETLREISQKFQGNSYSIQTIRNVISELSRNELIIRHVKKNYFINPLFFMKFAPELNRKKLIVDLYKQGLFANL